jgi:hypothetical protein
MEEIAVEVLLAAAVDNAGGVLKINSESLAKHYGDYVLALDYDPRAEQLLITLVDKDTAEYEDE